jgi:phage terminase large subunit-like protein
MPSSKNNRELLALLEEKQRRLDGNKIAFYSPYKKQRAFHKAGAKFKERLLRAGNQNGKTFAGSSEMSYHLTGDYPEWWDGKRFTRPIIGWAGSDTGETTRDNPQRALIGNVGEVGTGAVPVNCIGNKKNALGVADLFDYVKVKHVSGGWSTLRFKYYAQGQKKWQGPPVDVIWLDEEPPEDIYSEAYARTIATSGILFTTFTPLMGMSSVVRRFIGSNDPTRHDTNMTIDDAEHIPKEEREQIIASFLDHEREARAKGIPTLGSGRIFPVAESVVSIEAFKIPDHWAFIGGLDFGWDHPTAAVKLAHDRDNDCVYVVDCYKKSQATPLIHSGAVKPWGVFPWAWPHDGYQHDKGSGKQISEQYREHGLNMLRSHITFEDGGNGVEAGLSDMLERMQTGRFKVFAHLVEWFEEFRLYHRKDGKVVKEYDDIMAATRYAVMGLRFAEQLGGPEGIDIDFSSEWG